MSESKDKTIKQDHGEQFISLFVRHQKQIYATILGQIPNTSDADDIFQETMAVCWRKFDQFEPGTHFVRWACTIAKYIILDFRRRRASKGVVLLADDILDALSERCECVQDHVTDRLEALQGCVAKLDDRARRLVRLKYEQDESVENIALEYNLSTRRIYQTLSQINGVLLRCIRRTLTQRGVIL